MELLKQRRAFIQYMRDRKRRPVGVVVVYRANNGAIKAGYSKCHRDDSFSRETGLYTALQRAQPVESIGQAELEEMPTGVGPLMSEVITKAARYFRPKPTKGRSPKPEAK